MNVMLNNRADTGHYPLLGGRINLPRQFIVDNAYLRDDDAAFVGGSLIEGIGNSYSDVDVHVVTESLLLEQDIDPTLHYRVLSPDRTILTGRTPQAEVFLIHTVVPGSDVKVDIEYRTLNDVERLAKTVRETFDYATRSLVLLTKYLPARDMAFIHRLFHSQTLAGESVLARLRDEIGEARFRYLMYRWKASDYSVLLDILGAWEDGDWIRCVDMARENMVTQFQAFTHLMGNTNYHRKWILSYARRLSCDLPLLDRYISLLTAGSGSTADEQRAFILATIDFVDELFNASSVLLQGNASYPCGTSACAAIDRYVHSEAADYSEREVAYRKKAYGVRGVPTREWFQS